MVLKKLTALYLCFQSMVMPLQAYAQAPQPNVAPVTEASKVELLKLLRTNLNALLEIQDIVSDKYIYCLNEVVKKRKSYNIYIPSQKRVEKIFGAQGKNWKKESLQFCTKFLGNDKSQFISYENLGADPSDDSMMAMVKRYLRMRKYASLARPKNVLPANKNKLDEFGQGQRFLQRLPVGHLFSKFELDYLNKDLPQVPKLAPLRATEQRTISAEIEEGLAISKIELYEKVKKSLWENSLESKLIGILWVELSKKMTNGSLSEAELRREEAKIEQKAKQLKASQVKSRALQMQGQESFNYQILTEMSRSYQKEYYNLIRDYPILGLLEMNQYQLDKMLSGRFNGEDYAETFLLAFSASRQLREKLQNAMFESTNKKDLLWLMGLNSLVQNSVAQEVSGDATVQALTKEFQHKEMMKMLRVAGIQIGAGAACVFAGVLGVGSGAGAVVAVGLARLFICNLIVGVGMNLWSYSIDSKLYRQQILQIFSMSGLQKEEGAGLLQDLSQLNSHQNSVVLDIVLLPTGAIMSSDEIAILKALNLREGSINLIKKMILKR